MRYQRNYKSKTCNDGSGQSDLRRKLINKEKELITIGLVCGIKMIIYCMRYEGSFYASLSSVAISFSLLARLLLSTRIKVACISHLGSYKQSLLRTRAGVNVGVITTFRIRRTCTRYFTLYLLSLIIQLQKDCVKSECGRKNRGKCLRGIHEKRSFLFSFDSLITEID